MALSLLIQGQLDHYPIPVHSVYEQSQTLDHGIGKVPGGAVSRELFPRLSDDLRGLNSAGSPADGRMDAAPLSLAVTWS